MKKVWVLMLTCCLLLPLVWSGPASTAYGAVAKVKLSVNGKVLQFPVDGTPYVSGSAVMVPLSPAGKALGFTVKYTKGTNLISLSGEGQQLSLKLGGNEATVNGNSKVSFEGKVVLQNNRIYVPLGFFYALGLVTSYDTAMAEAAVNTPQNLAEAVTRLFASGKYEELSQRYLSEDMKTKITVLKLQQGWESIAAPNGTFVQLKPVLSSVSGEGIAIKSTISFTKGNVALFYAINSSGQITGLQIAPLPIELPVPANVVEEEVVVGAGTAHPLKGTLTLPGNAAGPLPAVVLVQGTGATDRDETAHGYKPFRDIAWGLAQQGIAVLRYDKRNYTYPQEFMGKEAAGITVKEETVDDAIAATQLLKNDKRMDPKRVYLAGHSLGGMLAPRIDADGGDYAGLILLAGSPRKLWEIAYDQGLAAVSALDDKDPLKAQSQAWLAAELTRANTLSSWSDAEAKSSTVFGLPAYSLKEMEQHNIGELARKLTKPVLVLQGADDFQVYANKDYPLWQEVLKGNSLASYKLYPGLSHFFVNYDGAGAGTSEEYYVSGLVDSRVIMDIGEWIKGQK